MSLQLKILLLTAIVLTVMAIVIVRYQNSKLASSSAKHHFQTEAQYREDQKQAESMAKEMIRKERQQQRTNSGH